MPSRRTFIKSSSLFSAGILAAPSFYSLSRYKKWDLGVQLYTVRDQMDKDPSGTLAKVAQIGFNTVEGTYSPGGEKFYGMEATAFAAMLKQHGLTMPSAHYRLGEEAPDGEMKVRGTLLHDWDKAVEDAHAIGLKYMICAWLSPAERGGLDHYKKLAEIFNKAAEKCKAAGIQFCHHNHDFEFEQQDGHRYYDVILDNTDKNLVKMEMDLYWVTKAGMDPIAIIEKHPGRFPLWHLKDMDNTPEHSFTEVGHGTIDFKKIFAHSGQAGLKYFYVEQDKCPGSPFDSISQSIAYVRQNLI
ncbi:MAG: sugar phosphate isomerase/epimerase family protein [Bacteroidota bacterium]|nr:sugar phosphate isomerase/epimerase family protein [Bacteroidota bacterium]MDP4254172.1 sugar phosphate isomerase/epimerase family protein [Bacteroidota bacterium]MDP4258964.1 sugar phosphate isomerase/epimerase family protein [Bacteroidota bacterium]